MMSLSLTPMGSPSTPLITSILSDPSSQGLTIHEKPQQPPKDTETTDIQHKLNNGEYKIVMKSSGSHKRSVIWETFGEIYDRNETRVSNFIACSKCHKVCKFITHKTGTSNILKHRCVLSMSIMLTPTYKERDRKIIKKSSSPSPNTTVSTTPAVVSTALVTCPEGKLVSTAANEANKRQLRVAKDHISKECVRYTCRNLSSLTAVSSKPMLDLMQTCVDLAVKFGHFEVSQSVPNASVLQQKIKVLAVENRAKLAGELKNLLGTIGGSLSLEVLKDPNNKTDYFIITLHTMKDFTKVTRYLKTAEFDTEYRLSCENMIGVLYQTLKDYDLHDHFHRLVYITGQDTDLINALGTSTRLSCVTTAINAVLEYTMQVENSDVIGEVYCLWNYCCALVNHLTRTGLQEQLERRIHKPKDSSPWVTRLPFLQDILVQWDIICNLLRNRDEEAQYCSPVNIGILGAVVEFITPFTQAIKDLTSHDKPTLHLVIVWYTRLIKDMQPENTDSILINNLKTNARTYLMQMEVHQLHRIALFLHPKLKSLKLLQDDSLKLSVQAEVRSMVSAQVINCYMEVNGCQVAINGNTKSNVNNNEIVRTRKNINTLSDLEDTSDDDGSSFESDEVNKYLLCRVPKTGDFDLLKWWAAHETEFPRLSRVSQYVHSIPASHTSHIQMDLFSNESSSSVADDMLFLRSYMS